MPATGRISSAWPSRAAACFRGWRAYLAWSLALLAPCYWQSRIQAGDLSSHIYNSWLAQLIESGRAPGLAMAHQSTNVLFDLILGGLFRAVGAGAAQRIAVSLAVLVFAWGAFAFISAAAGRRAWNLLPCIAMLAYGWVFHMGFFNFYMAMGLCFWAMTLAWEPRPLRLAGALAILFLAYLAHALPVAWSLGLMGYLALARRRSPRGRALLTLGALALTGVVRIVASSFLTDRWSVSQITKITGADQLWVFDGKYYFALIGLLFVWGALFLNLLRNWGARRVFSSLPFQFFVVSAGAVLILPSAVLIPGFRHSLAFIAERMSLGVAVCVCALLGAARPRAFERFAMLGLAILFFSFLYPDERGLNAFEDRMQDAVAQLQPGQRVVSLVDDPDLRVNALIHMIDRVCIGRCYSFANYEPATAQFRVRAVDANPYVVKSYADSWALQTGAYAVKPSDEPIYAVDVGSSGRLIIKRLKAGALCGSTYCRVLREFVPAS